MASPNLVERSLRSLGETVTALRTGEGEGSAARLGRSARKGIRRAKAGLKNLQVALGFSSLDTYEDDPDEQQRRRRARALIGDDLSAVCVQQDQAKGRNLNATVAPEFRAQVAAGFAAANTYTTGSTTVSPDGDSDPDGF